jgi:hypothetical protein
MEPVAELPGFNEWDSDDRPDLPLVIVIPSNGNGPTRTAGGSAQSVDRPWPVRHSLLGLPQAYDVGITQAHPRPRCLKPFTPTRQPARPQVGLDADARRRRTPDPRRTKAAPSPHDGPGSGRSRLQPPVCRQCQTADQQSPSLGAGGIPRVGEPRRPGAANAQPGTARPRKASASPALKPPRYRSERSRRVA